MGPADVEGEPTVHGDIDWGEGPLTEATDHVYAY